MNITINAQAPVGHGCRRAFGEPSVLAGPIRASGFRCAAARGPDRFVGAADDVGGQAGPVSGSIRAPGSGGASITGVG
jgi:hypothetical protein